MHLWIEDAAELERWFAQNASPHVIGLDTEFVRTNTFRSRLALVQVNVGGAIALIDAPRLVNEKAIERRLRQADCICVMHSASEDLEALSGVVPDGPYSLFDTQIAAAMAGLGFGLSYQKLVAQTFGVDLPKGETRSDWLMRPLSASQREYAAQDVEHLPALHAELSQKLAALGRESWLTEDCRRLVDRVCHAQPDLQPQRSFRGAAEWPREQQALLRKVLLWRDASARTLDKPRPWILDDAHALALTLHPPASEDELFERSKGLRALRGPQRRELFDLLHAPVAAEELDIAAITKAPSSAEKRLLSNLRDEIARIAAELGLPDGLLCPRRHLETLVAERRWPDALEGWRKPLLHDTLMTAMDRPA